MLRTRRRSWRSSFASDVTAAASSDRAADRPGGTVARQMRVRANAYPLPPAEARLAGTRPVVARSSCHTNTARSVAAPAAARERGTFARASGEVGFHPSGAVAGVAAPGHARRVPGSLPPGGQARTPDRIPSRPRRPRQARPARPPHNAPGTSRPSLHHRCLRVQFGRSPTRFQTRSSTRTRRTVAATITDARFRRRSCEAVRYRRSRSSNERRHR